MTRSLLQPRPAAASWVVPGAAGLAFPIAVAAVAAGGLALRLLGLEDRWLWFDELLSVNFANHAPVEALITAARFDVHPPLYYLQLCLWMTFGQSDAYVALNAVAWGVVAIVFIMLAAERLSSPAVAIAAGALTAAAPAAVIYSQQVRMYAMIMAMLAIAFHALVRYLAEARRRDLAVAVAAVIVAVYSHGVGLIMAGGVCAYGAARAALERPVRPMAPLLLAAAAIALASLPAVFFSGSRGVLHTATPDLAVVAQSARELMFGFDNWLAACPPGWAAALFAALAALCLAAPAARIVFATTVACPIAAVWIVSHAITPIWLTKTIVVVLPFVALAVALAIGDLAGRVRPARLPLAAATLVLVGLLGSAAIQQQLSYRNGDDYRPAAAYLRAQMRPGDAVYANLGPYESWALLWYLGGPGWGTPLAYHEVNATWRRYLDRLGTQWVRRLGLMPTRDHVVVDGTTVTSAFAQPISALATDRILVVGPEDAPIAPGERWRRQERRSFNQLAVDIWSRP